MIHRLLEGLNPGNYCLISQRDYSVDTNDSGSCGRLRGRYYQLKPGLELRRGYRFGLNKWRWRFNVLLGPFATAWYGRKIAQIVRQEGCTAIVACSGDLVNLPAAFLASRICGVPFYPYLFDDYSNQWSDPAARLFAQILEPVLLKRAKGIIVPNQFLRDDIRHRHSVGSTVIHNPCDLAAYAGLQSPRATRKNGEVRIVYTGAVYAAHYDAFRNLLSAISLLEPLNIWLHLYTSTSPCQLEREGIDGPVVCHDHQPAATVPGLQGQADILFLPLAFNSPYPRVVRTSAPGKIGEYLASGRPILVHAPPDSFVAWYFRKHQCGLVVSRSDPAQLADAINSILTDAGLRDRLQMRARNRAQSDYGVSVARGRFARLVGMELPIRENLAFKHSELRTRL